jgi:hypothetical protein
MPNFEQNFFNYFNILKRQILTQPLVLGGYTGSGGGAGGPPGGFLGYLPQYRVTYDLSELESDFSPTISGSLLDNLNRIRYRVHVLEESGPGGGGGSISLYQNDVMVASGVTKLNFEGSVTVIDEGSNKTTVTVTASGSSGGTSYSDYVWYADGFLVTASGVDPNIVIPRNCTIQSVYANVKIAGDSGSTIIDVNKNGTTIFTNQGNRPSIAFNDADKTTKSGTPDVVSLVEYDVLSLDIDSVAVNAESLSVIITMSGSGGGSSSSSSGISDMIMIQVFM